MYLTAAEFDAVWRKGHPIVGYDPASWRRDDYGSAMRYSDHGNRSSDFGWEMDHIVKKEHGGSDTLSNLRPLQWLNNVKR